MIRISINGKTRIIRKIHTHDEKHLEAEYHGWLISIYPMWGKVVRGVYRDDLETGESGVDVRGWEGGYIVNAVTKTFDAALQMAMENILLCEPRYER